MLLLPFLCHRLVHLQCNPGGGEHNASTPRMNEAMNVSSPPSEVATAIGIQTGNHK